MSSRERYGETNATLCFYRDLTPIALDKPIEKESVLSDDDDDDFLAITAPITIPEIVKKDVVVEEKVEEKKVTTTPSAPPASSTSSFKFTPITFESKKPAAPAATKETTAKKVSTTTTTKTTVKATVTTSTSTTTAITAAATTVATKKADPKDKTKAAQDLAERIRLEAERKLERSKRFGIKLDEKEMKEIRAARFGIVSKPAEETPAAKKESKKVNENKNESAQTILKKRAERFGIPEKKVVPAKEKKKAAKATPVQQTPAKGKTLATTTKKANQNNITKVKGGRVQKPVPASTVKKVNLNNVTKNNVLNKKQNNVNKKLTEAAIAQKKKNIVNHRKENIKNNNMQQRRMKGFDPTPIIKQLQLQPAKRQSPTAPMRNNANQNQPNADIIGNGRTIFIANGNQSTPTPTANKPKHRKRGRGPESNHYIKVSTIALTSSFIMLTYILG